MASATIFCIRPWNWTIFAFVKGYLTAASALALISVASCLWHKDAVSMPHRTLYFFLCVITFQLAVPTTMLQLQRALLWLFRARHNASRTSVIVRLLHNGGALKPTPAFLPSAGNFRENGYWNTSVYFFRHPLPHYNYRCFNMLEKQPIPVTFSFCITFPYDSSMRK